MLDHGDKTVKCINCAANHLLDNCPSFLEKTLRERISFLAKKKFCYACLQPMKQGHNAMRNKSGPRMEPCGTPQVILRHIIFLYLPSETNCCRSFK